MASRCPISGERRTITDRAGRTIPVVINASIITDDADQVIGGFEALRDISPFVEAEQKIELLTEMSQEGILMLDQTFRVVFTNSRMAELLGFTKEQLIGMKAEEVIGHPEMLRTFYDPEQARQNMRKMRSPEYGPPGKLNTTRVTFVRKGGNESPSTSRRRSSRKASRKSAAWRSFRTFGST